MNHFMDFSPCIYLSLIAADSHPRINYSGKRVFANKKVRMKASDGKRGNRDGERRVKIMHIQNGCCDNFAAYATSFIVVVTEENMVHPGGDDSAARLALRAVAYATLSHLVLAMISQTIKQRRRCY
ncbi:hypothetical protein MJK72_22305 [Klebsiella pneumoniae]|nr:hypothetical protein MJK72_22305 [Klebsiella pneumoniae]